MYTPSILDGLTRIRPMSAPSNPAPHSPAAFQNRIRVQSIKPDGTVRDDSGWLNNIMTTFGLASLASRIGTVSGANANTTTEFVSAIKIGTDTTAATSNDTKCGASTASITMGNASFTKSNLGNRTVEYQATFASNAPAGTAVINEVALHLNSTADSQAACRTVLGTASVNKLASDTINVSYDWVLTTA